MSNLEKRWLAAKDFLNDPSMLDIYPNKYVILVDRSSDVSHQNLLAAIEQMENRGWALHNVCGSDSNGNMCALMYRK